MNKELLQAFQREVALQCRFIGMAAEDLDDALQGRDVEYSQPKWREGSWVTDLIVERTIDHERVWFCVQSLLVAFGNLAKLLWPSYERRSAHICPDRGPALRASLHIPEVPAPLHRKLRSLRNRIEHYDEQLEEWSARAEQSSDAFDRVLYAHGATAALLSKGLDGLLRFDQQNRIVYFQGEEYRLDPLVDFVISLGLKASLLGGGRMTSIEGDLTTPEAQEFIRRTATIEVDKPRE